MTWTGAGVPCQRWVDGLERGRSDWSDLGAYEVALIAGDREPRDFVRRHHYSRSYPAARLRAGLYHRGELAGVAVFSHPPSERVLRALPCDRLAGVELGRLVLLPRVPGNGESWFIARCFELVRRLGIEVVVAHSDPVRRRSASGQVVLPGHVGVVYQATNATYAGRTKPSLLALLPDGTVFSARSMSKVRGLERGHRYCVDQLVDAGAPEPGAADLRDMAAWMWRSIDLVCTRVRHGGCHRYVWPLVRGARRGVAQMARGDYPRLTDVAVDGARLAA